MRFSDVQAWVAEQSAKRGTSTVIAAYSVLARILDDAVRDRMLASNPARGVKLPKRPPRRNVYLTAGQLRRLADDSGRYRSLVLLLGVGGLRWGEAAVLRPCDIDFLRRRVELHRNVVDVNGAMMVGSLKSNKNRAVVLPGFVVDALAQTAEGKGRDALLWPSRTGGYLGPPSSPDSWLAGAVARCQKADPTFPADHSTRTAPHGGLAGNPRWHQPEGGAAHARACQRGDDTRRVRRSVRFRLGHRRGKCGQNVATRGVTAYPCGAKEALIRQYPAVWLGRPLYR